MAGEVREVRVHEIDEAVAALGPMGEGVRPAAVLHPLSLVLRVEGQAVAAAVCVRQADGTHDLLVHIARADPDDAAVLLDKALRKLTDAGVRTTRVRYEADGGGDPPAALAGDWLQRVEPIQPPGAGFAPATRAPLAA